MSKLDSITFNLGLNLPEAIEANAYFYNTNLVGRARTPEILWMQLRMAKSRITYVYLYFAMKSDKISRVIKHKKRTANPKSTGDTSTCSKPQTPQKKWETGINGLVSYKTVD